MNMFMNIDRGLARLVLENQLISFTGGSEATMQDQPRFLIMEATLDGVVIMGSRKGFIREMDRNPDGVSLMAPQSSAGWQWMRWHLYKEDLSTIVSTTPIWEHYMGAYMGMQTSTQLQVYPAYGRTYKTAKQVIKAWKAGKDFDTSVQGYINCTEVEDVDLRGYTEIAVEYSSDHEPVIVWKKGGKTDV